MEIVSDDDRKSFPNSKARPEFSQLAIFLTVVETRSFTAAARQIGRTQPAVSQAIARLEEIYGGDLFERRRGAPLALTPIGEAILPSARIILHTVDQQMLRAAATAQSRVGLLTVGFHSGLMSGSLRAGLNDFVSDNRGVRVRLVEGFPHELHRHLNEREVDVMFAAYRSSLSDARIMHEQMWQEPLCLAVHAGHPIAGKKAFSWDEVAALPILLRTSEGESSAYHALLARIGERKIDVEQHQVSRDALLAMVGMGWGASVVFTSSTLARPDVAFRPIVEPNATVAINAIWPSADRNPLRHKLLTYIRQHAKTESVLD